MSSHIPLPKDKNSKSKLFATVSSLSSKKQEHIKYIETHPFNYRLTVVAPAQKEADFRSAFANIDVYYRVNLKLADIIDPAFIQAYIAKDGVGFIALSAGRRIDTDDVFAIDGNGKLVMSVCKDTYEVLGLVGRQAQFPLERGARFVIEVDLLGSWMDPEKNYFRRLHSRLLSVFDDRIEFFAGIYDGKTGSSLKFDYPGATECTPAVEVFAIPSVLVPDLAASTFITAEQPSDEWLEQAHEIYEWIGLASIGARVLTHPDNSAYGVYEPNVQRDISVITIEGMLSPKAISTAVQFMLQQKDPGQFFLCVWGNEDAPVSWSSSEHGYLLSGEHMFAQAYQPASGKCITFQACGPWDAYS
ncbi:hypothetical protein GGI25_002557 [Coemansia spiralis]|uniref:Uncharacterized protein n=2 Tax=Coemansia TaxID=4863 RepID=A0A9W8G7Q0_9FUNG|nr:ribonuclease P 40kDa subunit-domain-containing protein [Coemansia spiralis]KAJ1992999.1 hypothetical protein EDC05_002440 [Coemansia umbellata]KAJ2622879.1 hypothetical protein GGI26_002845 [Coemansia sp. RSA 1358]KAJ2678206.1 hypothetical protein GGI25_002557 [Coemansia spiralis]